MRTASTVVQFEVEEKPQVEQKEKKEFDGKGMVLYPSAKTKIRFALIDLGENADWLLNDDKGRDNPNKTVFTVNSLVEPFNGSRKAISGRRLIQYRPKENVVRNGNVVAKAGEVSSYYDKYGKCELTDLYKQWDEQRGEKNKYRVSGAETYFLAHVFDITNLETNEKKEVNQVALIGFNVMDVYSMTAKLAVGKKLESFLNADEDGDVVAQNYSLIYTAGVLDKSKKEMTSKEQSLIDELRSKKDELMEDYKHLLPIPYKTLMEAVERGEYQLSYPQASKDGGFGNNMTEEIPF